MIYSGVWGKWVAICACRSCGTFSSHLPQSEHFVLNLPTPVGTLALSRLPQPSHSKRTVRCLGVCGCCWRSSCLGCKASQSVRVHRSRVALSDRPGSCEVISFHVHPGCQRALRSVTSSSVLNARPFALSLSSSFALAAPAT